MVGGGLERAIRGGSVRPERNGGGGAEELARAPARRSGELSTSVRSSGGDREFGGGPGSISQRLNDSGMMAQWRQQVEEEKGSSRGGALLLKAA
jgi:hypothetical protein